MIQALFQLAVDDADVLQTAGSSLKQAPGDGIYRLWYGSDQVDGQISVNVKGQQAVETSEMRVITVNVLNLDRAPDAIFSVKKGDTVTINYNEVTAGTATLAVRFLDLVDMLLEQGKSPSAIARELMRLGGG